MPTIDDSELKILQAFEQGQLKSVATKTELVLQLHFPLDSVSSGAIVVESGHGLVSATP